MKTSEKFIQKKQLMVGKITELIEEDRAIFQILSGIFTRGSEKKEFELMLSPEETVRMFF